MQKIKIALVDDHNLFRKGIRSILDQCDDLEVVFEAVNGQEFLDNPMISEIELALLDIQMPVLDGIGVLKELRGNNNQLKIIVLSMHDEDHFIMHLMELGANGYLLKDMDIEEVIEAIRRVADSGIYFSDFVSRVMHRKLLKPHKSVSKIFNYKTDLSDRELEVLKYICDGLTTTEIGDKMFISPRTVEGHRVRIMDKLEVNNTAKLVAFAIKNELIYV